LRPEFLPLGRTARIFSRISLFSSPESGQGSPHLRPLLAGRARSSPTSRDWRDFKGHSHFPFSEKKETRADDVSSPPRVLDLTLQASLRRVIPFRLQGALHRRFFSPEGPVSSDQISPLFLLMPLLMDSEHVSSSTVDFRAPFPDRSAKLSPCMSFALNEILIKSVMRSLSSGLPREATFCSSEETLPHGGPLYYIFQRSLARE